MLAQTLTQTLKSAIDTQDIKGTITVLCGVAILSGIVYQLFAGREGPHHGIALGAVISGVVVLVAITAINTFFGL